MTNRSVREFIKNTLMLSVRKNKLPGSEEVKKTFGSKGHDLIPVMDILECLRAASKARKKNEKRKKKGREDEL